MAPVLQPHEGLGLLPPKEHKHRRRFIGPMPETVFASEVPANRQTRKKRGWFSSSSRASATSQEDEDQCLRDVIKVHAYEFFKGHGGKDEDWGEQEEKSVREEMLRRWRQSEWGKLRRAKEGGTKNRWVGTSFDIGTFLGVNVLDKDTLTTSPTSSPPRSPAKSTHPISIDTGTESVAGETFVTAPDQLSPRPPARKNGVASGTLTDLQNPSSYFPLPTPSEEQTPGDFLQGSSGVMDRLHAPDVSSLAHSNATADHVITPSQTKGKGKQVHYEDEVRDDGPTSPSEVLARSGPEVAETSAGAVEAARVDSMPEEDGVIMRGQLFMRVRRTRATGPDGTESSDRMLVRVSHTDADSVGSAFDENRNRITQHLDYEDWSEFMVVWRKGRLELYEDHAS